jgi:hypothetical protein
MHMGLSYRWELVASVSTHCLVVEFQSARDGHTIRISGLPTMVGMPTPWRVQFMDHNDLPKCYQR